MLLFSVLLCFQVVLQLCYILLGGCSLFNLLTIALGFSLLDDEAFDCSPVPKKKAKTKSRILLALEAVLYCVS